jgi:hypothetical protein
MKNKASIEIQIPSSLSYSLIYQGEASPLKGSSHPRVRWCVSILIPSPSIYRLGSPRKNTPSTTGVPLGSNRETTHGRWAWTALRWGRLTCRVGEDQRVWGLVDGHSQLWWVIDNVVWTNSWPSIAGASCDLIYDGAGEERVRKVYACGASEEWRDK